MKSNRLSSLIEEIRETLREDVENNPGQEYASAEWCEGEKIIEVYVSPKMGSVDVWCNKKEKYLTNIGKYLTDNLPSFGELEATDWEAYAADQYFQQFRENRLYNLL